ncbi:hypothetical protein F7725_009771 [Dissostichus mawsoni]|uniref:Uncharacterized protein n=1 Tax=Dissostichus mawsoni TaxID=36200 RepID=A0A7J5XMD1_DISMA|nr:hypothetical protein F7725_009771 [Dissostichus mawsoni]
MELKEECGEGEGPYLSEVERAASESEDGYAPPPSAHQRTLWPAARPLPHSCRCPQITIRFLQSLAADIRSKSVALVSLRLVHL